MDLFVTLTPRISSVDPGVSSDDPSVIWGRIHVEDDLLAGDRDRLARAVELETNGLLRDISDYIRGRSGPANLPDPTRWATDSARFRETFQVKVVQALGREGLA